MKECRSCRLWKPLDQFQRRLDTRDKLFTRCRPCQLTYSNSWRAKNMPKVLEARAESKRQGRAKQAGCTPAPRCEICGFRFSGGGRLGTAHYDHNHKTDEFRGWLCSRCNTGIGQLGDNPLILERAANYLRVHGHYTARPVLR